MAQPWPTEITLNRDKNLLTIRYDDGTAYALAAEYLRVESPSAEVKGHGPGRRQIVGGKKNVRITGVEPVGNYAVRILFDDGHDTGLYSWDYLFELGREHDARWRDYIAALRSKGLSRA